MFPPERIDGLSQEFEKKLNTGKTERGLFWHKGPFEDRDQFVYKVKGVK